MVLRNIFKKSGVREHIFCSAVPFASWWRHFCAFIEEIKGGAGKIKVFEVKQTSFFYSNEHGNCLQDPRSVCLQHTKVVQQAIQSWCKGLLSNTMLARVFNGALNSIKIDASRIEKLDFIRSASSAS